MKQSKKVMITGASGFIGRHLVPRMRELGVSVRVLVRRDSHITNIIDKNVELFYGDLSDAVSLNGLCKDVDLVFHLAVTQRFDLGRRKFLKINVDGTRCIIQQAIREGVRRFVLVSTGGIHQNTHGEPVREDSTLQSSNLYLESKIEAENIAWELFRTDPDRLTVVRPGAVYGPDDRRLLKLFRAVSRRHFIMIGPGSTRVHPVYIDDLIDGLLLAASQSGRRETFLMSGPDALSVHEWVIEIARAAGVAPPRWRIPAGPVRIAATGCEALCRTFGISPPLNHRRLAFFLNHRSYDLTKARTVLGYDPRISVREGTRRTLESYEAKGWL